MLSLDHVSVAYGPYDIVQNVSLTLSPGQWLMLCGPNGAGKSTLVNAIAQGVPYAGTIALDGKSLKKWNPGALARRIGILSQTHQVSYAFTVEEVVSLGRYAYSAGLFSKGDPEGTARIEAALEAVGLTDLRRQSMLSLSGGEVQRTFLAQVFAQEPSILILDEPANHLDLVYQQQLFALLEDWLKAPGRAVISVVHDLSLAKKFGTHSMLLQGGHVVAQGLTQEVLTGDKLAQVYGMDVQGWMQGMLAQWRD